MSARTVNGVVSVGEVTVPAEIPVSRSARTRGLLGRDGIDGALVLRGARQVHTVGMRFPIDVAFCAADGTVLHTAAMRPGRVSRVVWRSRFVVEAAVGSFAQWGMRRGATVALRESAGDE